MSERLPGRPGPACADPSRVTGWRLQDPREGLTMPRPEDPVPNPDPAPRGRRSPDGAWEAVVRQELLGARRRREPRSLQDAGLPQVLPALRNARADEQPDERA